MRADRPVLISAAFLAAGLSVLFCYGSAGSGLNAALPMSNSGFHLTLVTGGGAAIGGVILTIIGVLCFIWAIIAALGTFLTRQGRIREVPVRTPVQAPAEQPRIEVHPEPSPPPEGPRRIF